MKLSEHIQIDDENDVVTICGIRYAGQVFRGLGEALPIGRTFHVEKREDGVLAIFQHAPDVAKVKTWAECPIRTELRGTTAYAMFIDNDRQEEAVAAVEAMIPDQYRASARRSVFPFVQLIWDKSDLYHTGLAVAGWKP